MTLCMLGRARHSLTRWRNASKTPWVQSPETALWRMPWHAVSFWVCPVLNLGSSSTRLQQPLQISLAFAVSFGAAKPGNLECSFIQPCSSAAHAGAYEFSVLGQTNLLANSQVADYHDFCFGTSECGFPAIVNNACNSSKH